MPATPKKIKVLAEDRNWRQKVEDRELQERLRRIAREEGVDFFELASWPLSEPEWLIQGWLVSGMGLLINGDPKSFKSTIAMQLAWTIATGEPFLGRYPYLGEPKNVLYLHEENTLEDVRRHSMETLARQGYGHIVQPSATSKERKFQRTSKQLETRKKLLVRPRVGWTVTEENIAALKDQIVGNEIEYLILDPLYKIQTEGSGLNDDKAIAHVTVNLDRLTEETGCQIILIHHNNKSKSAHGGHRIMGSNLIHGWAPQLWLLEKGEELVLRGQTAHRVSVTPDFRSMGREWKEKNLLYVDWAWREEGQYLPGEKKIAGRKINPDQAQFIDDWNAGRLKGLSVRAIAERYEVGKSTVSNWKKSIRPAPVDPDEL
jgi:hypothetical protein